MEIRELTVDDVPFLKEMLFEAVNWRPGEPVLSLDELLNSNELGRYHREWGRPGDHGLVAWEGNRRIGAIWWRLLTSVAPGYGYVDDETPELGIGVVSARRRAGVGRELLRAAADRGTALGLRRICLNVSLENPAKRLYESVGFVDYERRDGSMRMVLDLTAER